MSTLENPLLTKPLEDCTNEELFSLFTESSNEFKRRAFENLKIVADQYIQLYGDREGMEQMGEDLCREVAPRRHPDGWSGFVRHLVKISG